MGLKGALCALGFAVIATSSPAQPMLEIDVPHGIAIGDVRLRAIPHDERVKYVKWIFSDSAHTSKAPDFTKHVDLGKMPLPRELRVVAYDEHQNPLYERQTVINAGMQRPRIEIVQPIDGEQVHEALVQVRADLPPGTALESVVLTYGEQRVPMRKQEDLYEAAVKLPPARAILTVTATTNTGTLEDVVVVNTPPERFSESIDVHIIEQLIRFEGRPKEVKVLIDGEETAVREVKQALELPLQLGIVMNINALAQDKLDVQKATATAFINSIMTEKDRGFMLGYGAVNRVLQQWTSDPELLVERISGVRPVASSCEGMLYDGIIESVYQFQGGMGAKALVILTDGYDYGYAERRTEDMQDPCNMDVREDGTPLLPIPRGSAASLRETITYLKQSGVKAYIIGVDTKARYGLRTGKGVEVQEESKWVVYRDLLKDMARVANGKFYAIDSAEQLDDAFRDIQQDLDSQYLVSFKDNTRKGGFHTVEIFVDGKRVKSNPGFYH